MKPMCRWLGRVMPADQAAQNTLRSTLLARHLRRCEACRQEQRALHSLAEELSVGLSAPRPPDAFAQDLWARIDLASSLPPRPSRRQPHYAALTLASLLLAAVCWRGASTSMGLFRSPRQGDNQDVSQARGSAKTNLHRALGTPEQEEANRNATGAAPTIAWTRRARQARRQNLQAQAGGIKNSLAHAESADSANSIVRIKARRVSGRMGRIASVPRRTRQQSAWHGEPAPRQSGMQIAGLKQGKGWAQSGALCEANGDYDAAADAYRRAYANGHNPNAAFAAGRAAEMSGDTPQALEDYARALSADASARAGADSAGTERQSEAEQAGNG